MSGRFTQGRNIIMTTAAHADDMGMIYRAWRKRRPWNGTGLVASLAGIGAGNMQRILTTRYRAIVTT